MHSLFTKAISTAIPKLVDSGIDWLKTIIEPDSKSPKPPVVTPTEKSSTFILPPRNPDTVVKKKNRAPYKRKITRDRSPFSRQQAQYVIDMLAYMEQENYNRPPHIPMKTKADLVIELNDNLHKNKSQTFYARIWNGRVDLESFPNEDTLMESKK